MRNLKKLLKTMGIVVGITALFAVPVMAQQQFFDFYVEAGVDDADDTWYSGANPKNDNEQAGYINTTSGNISNADEFYMAILDENYNNCTGNRRISSNTAHYYLGYNQGIGTRINESMYLKGVTYAYPVHLTGNWFS